MLTRAVPVIPVQFPLQALEKHLDKKGTFARPGYPAYAYEPPQGDLYVYIFQIMLFGPGDGDPGRRFR